MMHNCGTGLLGLRIPRECVEGEEEGRGTRISSPTPFTLQIRKPNAKGGEGFTLGAHLHQARPGTVFSLPL